MNRDGVFVGETRRYMPILQVPDRSIQPLFLFHSRCSFPKLFHFRVVKGAAAGNASRNEHNCIGQANGLIISLVKSCAYLVRRQV